VNLRTYFLTLQRTPERAEAIMRELFRAGFQRPHCMLGVDAKQGIDHLPWWRPARATWLSRWGRLEPVIACAASHLRIYADALSRQTAALIFEDDARLLTPAERFHAALDEAPDGWDIIHFHAAAHYDAITFATDGHTPNLRRMTVPGFGAVAYAISPGGIYKLMHAAYPLDRPIDVTIRQTASLRIYRTLEPFTSRDGSFASGIR